MSERLTEDHRRAALDSLDGGSAHSLEQKPNHHHHRFRTRRCKQHPENATEQQSCGSAERTTAALVTGGLMRTVVPVTPTGSRGLMVAAVTEPGATGGGAEVVGGAVVRDCWLLRSVWRRAGRLF